MKEFYLGVSGGGPQELPRRRRATGAASAGWREAIRWPSTSTRSRRAIPRQREAELLRALPGQIAQAQRARACCAQAPRRRRPDEHRLARGARAAAGDAQVRAARAAEGAAPPFGGLAAIRSRPLWPRVFASPGHRSTSPRARHDDYWRTARALFAAGFRRGDLVHNRFTYHLTPGRLDDRTGAHALGCTVFPAGTGQTEQQVEAIADLQPDGYVGTPSFLKILLEKAPSSGRDVAVARKARRVGRGVSADAARLDQRARHRRVSVLRTADLGLIAYETPAREGLVARRRRDLEIVRPGTGDPVRRGEVGEVVVTTFNPDYPLIRFGTGDLSAVLPGASPCGPHQHAHQGLDGPRRPDHQGEGHVRASRAGGRDRAAPPGGAARAAGRRRRDGETMHDAQGRMRTTVRRHWPRRSAKRLRSSPSCAARSSSSRRAACPTTAR